MKILWVSKRFARQEAELDKLPPDEPVLMVDLDRCISCGSCQLACRLEQRADGQDEPALRPKVFRAAMKDTVSGTNTVRLPLSCQYCENPCAYQDRYGFWVTCPSGTADTAPRCDLCTARLDKGLMPACATRCTMKCIYFGRAEDLAFAVNEKRLRDMGEVLVTCLAEG